MEFRPALLILLVLLSGCISPSFVGNQTSNQSVLNQSDVNASEVSYQFSVLEGEIDRLIEGGNVIGSDHYSNLEQRILSFENKISGSDGERVRGKLLSLRPQEGCGTYRNFAMVEREIGILYSGKMTIGPDHYQRLKDALDCFAQQGIGTATLSNQLESISPHNVKSTGTTTQPVQTSSNLPSCTGQKFTSFFVDLNQVQEVTPLGNLGPPGHTLPTEHMYFHISSGGATTQIVPLKAPGDIYITDIGSSPDDIDPGRTEYSIHFALCKDVFGYFNHVKEISDELKEAWENAPCAYQTYEGDCPKKLEYFVKAGTEIGGVGHLQGNFDFGAYDKRIKNPFANLSRYTSRTPFIVCPVDLYEEPLKGQFYNKIGRIQEPRCGQVMQDVPGTLQGNWFFGDATPAGPPLLSALLTCMVPSKGSFIIK